MSGQYTLKTEYRCECGFEWGQKYLTGERRPEEEAIGHVCPKCKTSQPRSLIAAEESVLPPDQIETSEEGQGQELSK